MGVLRAQCNHAVPDRSLPPSCGYQRRSHRRAPEGDRRGWWSELPLRSARYWCGGASCYSHPFVYGKRDADAQLVTYPNGAVTPYDPNLAVATNAHLLSKGYGHFGFGYPYHYGKREADASLVTYPNGAVPPYDPTLAVATNAHLATRFGHYGYAGYPYGVVYGKREAEAQIPVGLVTGYAGVHHGVGFPYHSGYGSE